MWGSYGAGTYYVAVRGAAGATGSYSLRVEAFADTTSVDDAEEVGIGTETRGYLEDREDTDYFKVELTEETELIVRSTSAVPNTTGSGSRSSDEQSGGYEFSRGHLEGGLRQFLIREVLEAGVYYITVETYLTVESILRNYVHRGPYTLHVQAVEEEAGDSLSDAAGLAFDTPGAGETGSPSDVGYLRLDVTAPVHAVLVVVGDGVIPDAEVLDSRGQSTGIHVYRDIHPDTETLYKNIARTRLGRGTYFLKVRAGSGLLGEDLGKYVVQVIEDRHIAELVDLCGDHGRSWSDPLYGCQWNLDNTGQFGGVVDEDINVEGVWASGHQGAGVNVVVVDRPIDTEHRDLIANLDAARSHDYTLYDFTDSLGHGTGAAGIIAARDNSLGIRGVAPRVTVFGYNLLDDFTPDNLAQAMSAHTDVTHVSNNSWGHPDSPALRTAPPIWEVAVETGLRQGANGKGVVYVWAAGNGALMSDNANFSEYTNHYGVTAVCAVNNRGVRSSYSEQGANLWVCAPSSDYRQDRPGIITTLDYNTYSREFGGTSAAAPAVSGVVALLRGAYPQLTWRDVRLVLAGSARRNDPDNTGWAMSAAKYGTPSENYNFNHEYGFGVVDAGAALRLARGWTRLPPPAKQSVASTGGSVALPDSQTPVSTSLAVGSDVDGTTCEYHNDAFRTTTTDTAPPASVDFVEFVEIHTDFEAPAFRDLTVKLVSPSGAISILATPKPDDERVGLEEVYRFGSARHLGEDPAGTWTLQVSDDRSGGAVGTLNGWCLTIYGHRLRPGPPQVTGIPGNGILTVNWQPPANSGASEIAGYELRYIEASDPDRSDQNWTVVKNLGRRTRTRTIGGLTNLTLYDVEVRATNSHGAGPWQRVTAAPAVNTDPHFPQSAVSRFVVENPAPGTRVGQPVAAVETDSDRLTYTLAGGSGLFEIGEHSGQITVVDGATLDHETTTPLTLDVTVSDLKDIGGNPDTVTDDTVVVAIEVTNRNEPPRIDGPDLITHPEDRTTTDLDTFTASDPDAYSTITWSVSGTDADYFTIAGGRLRFRDPPDYENPADSNRDNRYLVAVQAGDGAHITTKQVTVEVTNTEELWSLTLSALQPQVGTLLVADLADPDGNIANRVWTWWRKPSRSEPWEAINSAATASYTPLAADIDQYLQARVNYRDGHGSGIESAYATSEFKVRAQPVNNQAPQFLTRETEQLTVRENTAAGTSIGSPVSAGDDGDPLSYTLEGPDAAHFAIDRHSGQLRTRVPLDYETRHTYRLRVRATDPSGQGASRTVTITVDNVDEPGTATLPTTTPRVATPVVASLDHDPDGAISGVSWSWQRSAFTVHWADITGANSSTYTPTDDDHENHLRAVASYTDGHGGNKTTRTPPSELVEEAPPIRITLASTQVSEGSSTTVTLTTGGRVFEGDQSATLYFTGTASEGDDYTANPTSLTITAGDTTATAVINALDDTIPEPAETIVIHLLHQDKVIGTDSVTIRGRQRTPPPPSTPSSGPGEPSSGSSGGGGGGGPVPLPPGANHPPEFSEGSRTLRTVAENSPAGTGIALPVTATDPEGDPLTYKLSDGAGDLFDIDTETGQLRTKAPLDYETTNSYTITVEVRDSKDPEGEPDQRRDDSITVTVNIVNRNDPGRVTLSAPTPRIGQPLQAALADPDGDIADAAWKWERSTDRTGWTPIPGATTSAYTPTPSDTGYYLRVGTTYSDPFHVTNTTTAAPDAAVTAGYATTFDDATPDGVHTPAINALAAEGLFADTGCGPNRFCPNEPILRWTMAVWLIRVLGDHPPVAAVSRFGDIAGSEWWLRHVEELADRRITLGCATDPPRYCPDRSVTRAQMSSFLVRAFNLPPAQTPAGFTDTRTNVHAANIDTLATADITLGCATDPLCYCPDQPVTRAQMATLLHRALAYQQIHISPHHGTGWETMELRRSGVPPGGRTFPQ